MAMTHALLHPQPRHGHKPQLPIAPFVVWHSHVLSWLDGLLIILTTPAARNGCIRIKLCQKGPHGGEEDGAGRRATHCKIGRHQHGGGGGCRTPIPPRCWVRETAERA